MITIEQFKSFILLFTLIEEGGYNNNPNDKGKETYRGISRVNNPYWEGWKIIDSLKPLKRGDVINHPGLKEAIAKLYFEKYFKANNFDTINSPIVALTLFDMAVNGGYCVKMLQESINRLNYNSIQLKPDGIWGAKTLSAINSVPAMILSEEVNKYRVKRFQRIVDEDPSQEENLEGWLVRVRKLNNYIKKG